MNAVHLPKLKADSLSDKVVDEITNMILRGGMHIGDWLPSVAELEANLGVSRTVVREALRILETRGLVQIHHGKGVMVTGNQVQALLEYLDLTFRVQRSTLYELMEVRTILEVEIAWLAAIRRTEEDLKEMEEALDRMARKAATPEGYVDADIDFHNALLKAAHNSVLSSVAQPIGELLRKSRELTFRGPTEGVTRARLAHQQIYDRVKAQDVDGARQAMQQHLLKTKEDIDLAVKEGRLKEELNTTMG